MTFRKQWTTQEDDIIRLLVEENSKKKNQDKLKWDDIAEQINTETGFKRHGKQCRDRWTNQLKPEIKKGKWGEKEIKFIFDSERKEGNRWSEIARKLPGRTDNQVKNFFYSSLRKGVRQINFYIRKFKVKNLKLIDGDTLIKKLMITCDGGDLEKLEIKSQKAFTSGRKIKEILVKLSMEDERTMNLVEKEKTMRQNAIRLIKEFGKTCKKRKTKKIRSYSDEESMEELSEGKEQVKIEDEILEEVQVKIQEESEEESDEEQQEEKVEKQEKKITLSSLISEELDEEEKKVLRNEKTDLFLTPKKQPFFDFTGGQPTFFQLKEIKDVQTQRKEPLKNHLFEEISFLNSGAFLGSSAEFFFNSDLHEKNNKMVDEMDNEKGLKLSKKLSSCEYFKKKAFEASSEYEFLRTSKDGFKKLRETKTISHLA